MGVDEATRPRPPPRSGIEGIELAILEGVAREPARALVRGLSRHVAVPCRVLKEADVSAPYVQGREQLDADELLAGIEAGTPGNGHIRVGVTGFDIGNPIFTFFFGRARQHGRAALISLCRLDPGFYGLPPDGELVIARAVKEIRHELGHVAGLPHCRDAACLMSFAATVESIDRRGALFCPECVATLPDWLR